MPLKPLNPPPPPKDPTKTPQQKPNQNTSSVNNCLYVLHLKVLNLKKKMCLFVFVVSLVVVVREFLFLLVFSLIKSFWRR